MKKLLAILIISFIWLSGVVEARGGGGRSSIWVRSVSRPSTLNTTKAPVAAPKPATTTTTRTTTVNNYGWGGWMFGWSLMWAVVGTVAGNMIYSSLTPGQSYGAYVNDWNHQYQQILSSTGSVVWYKEVPVEDDWLGWFWWLMIAGLVVWVILFMARDK